MDFQGITSVVVTLCLTLRPLFVEAGHSHEKNDVPAYFAFGDSIADVGTNNFLSDSSARADFQPYGETFFHRPTGRFTNGRNIVDFLAQALGLPFAPPFLQPNVSFIAGVNFASSGSGLLNNTKGGSVVPMSVQLEQYANVRDLLQGYLGAWGARRLISNSIFLVASGSNDLASGYLSKPEIQKQMNATQLLSLLVGAYRNTLTDLYISGARKAVIFGIAPLGCSPSARVTNPTYPGECLDAGNQIASGFNACLKQLMNELRVALPDFNIVLADTFNLITSMITDGKPFGLDNVNAACCGAGFLNAQVQCGRPVPKSMRGVKSSVCKRPSKYLFWDIHHPTEHVVKILFKNFWSGDPSTTYPFNLKTLAAL